MDGIDAALIETDGILVHKKYGGVAIKYDDEFRAKIREAIATKTGYGELARELSEQHGDATSKLLTKLNIKAEDVDIIGYHGQTVDHRPHERITVQLGDGALLANFTGIDVVNDMRSNDVKNGGQGAPLIPVFHAAIAHDLPKPVCMVNIGGVSNITWVGEGDSDIISFDTGTGNALIDDLILQKTGKPYDEDGKIAASGKIDENILAKLLQNPYFAKKPPKSLDRDEFVNDLTKDLSLEDAAATLTAFTAAAIARGAKFFPKKATAFYVGGGGRLNSYLMSLISKYCNNAPVHKMEKLKLDGDLLEAEAFAFLAVRSLKDLPLTFPYTTGVQHDCTGGVFHKSNNDIGKICAK